MEPGGMWYVYTGEQAGCQYLPIPGALLLVIHNPFRSYLEFPFNHPVGACGGRPASRTRLSARGLPGSRPSRSHSLRGSRHRASNECRRTFYVMFVIVDFLGRR